MPIELRPCDPLQDRVAAQRVLHDALTRDDVGYTIHPGEWDWWRFHADFGKPPPTLLIGDQVLVDLEADNGELSVFGATPGELAEVVARLDDAVRAIAFVADGDDERAALLQSLGFAPSDTGAGPVFARPAAQPVVVPPLPDGFVVRPVAGIEEAPLRSAAARRSFATKMAPDDHVARYRAFMQSPGYERERDLVVFDERNERVAAFAVHWVDAGLSLAQLEPVGTDPDYWRRGLGRILLAATFDKLAAEGIETVRVETVADYLAAVGLYRACGFAVVGGVRWWNRRDSSARG